MPSLILGKPFASGAQVVVSGYPWSGRAPVPYGGINFAWVAPSGAQAYIASSGGGIVSGTPQASGAGFMTLNSGQTAAAGGAASGMMDGFPIQPGGTYFLPRLACGPSGSIQVFANCDVTGSGVGRLYWEAF